MNDSLSQHQVVVQAIKQMIADGTVAPGDRLPVEAELADQLGVSRGSLREGVRALVAMGILETRQGSGTTVTSLDPALLLEPLVFWSGLQAGPSALNVHVTRRALEVEAAGIAAGSIDDETIAALDEVLRAADEPIRNHDHEGALRWDLEFHLGIARATGNPVLVALIEALGQPTVRTRLWQSEHEAGRLEAAHAEHRMILDQLRRHDSTGARATMQSHLLASVAHATGR